MVRDFIVEVDVGEGDLPAAASRELVELEDELLRELAVLIVAPADGVGREEHVYGVPADRAREVVLKHGGHLEHVREQDVGVLRGV